MSPRLIAHILYHIALLLLYHHQQLFISSKRSFIKSIVYKALTWKKNMSIKIVTGTNKQLLMMIKYNAR